MRNPIILGMFIIVLSLQGCADVALSGAQVVYNRHSIQKNLGDQLITMQIYQAIKFRNHDIFKDANISIATFNQIVLLAGQVPSKWQREKALEVVKRVPNIKEIYNLIEIASPSSSLTRLSDTWITTKVKGKMIASDQISPSNIKVVTENGTVFLIGTVQPNEAQTAVKIASTTDGVRNVVKIFSYITISKKL